MVDQSEFFNEPSNLSGWQLVGKVAIGILIGWVMAALLFVILSFIGTMFTSQLGQTSTTVNPMLSLILLFIAFLTTLIGNISVGGLYSLFYSKKYYNATKMFSLLLLANGILFFFMAPIYMIFGNKIDILFFVLWFHVLFSVFISAAQIEFAANPNYSASSLMGTLLGFTLSLLMYALIYKISGSAAEQEKMYLFMLLPPILAYTIVPFGAGIREKIYYKFYELGNNWLYIPTISQDDETSDTTDTSSDDEINIEN